MTAHWGLDEREAARLPRRSVLRELLVSMLTFGAVVGILFPLAGHLALGSAQALTGRFVGMSVAAGVIVGAVNFLIFRLGVKRELVRVVDGMRGINRAVAKAEGTGEICGESCRLEVTSSDIIGEVAHSFNDMAEAIARRIAVESKTRRLLMKLSTNVEMDEVANGILEALISTCNADGGILYGDTGNRYSYMTSVGIDQTEGLPDRIEATQGLSQRALTTSQVMLVRPASDGFEWVELSTPFGSLRPEAMLLVPLMAEQRPVGLAAIVCNGDTISASQRSLIDAIRTQAAPYLQTAIMHKKLRELAAIDDLTRQLNRRFGIRRLHEEFSRSVRHGVPISVLMLDIDHFKTFNDSFGHDAGDAVLSSIASTLEHNVRSGDVVCRYGGEEFMIVAPGMGMNDVSETAERLRRQIESTPIRWSGKDLAVTVSLGTATWPVVKASIEDELVTFADRALYHAKESGRNQVAVHQGDKVVPLTDLTLDSE